MLNENTKNSFWRKIMGQVAGRRYCKKILEKGYGRLIFINKSFCRWQTSITLTTIIIHYLLLLLVMIFLLLNNCLLTFFVLFPPFYFSCSFKFLMLYFVLFNYFKWLQNIPSPVSICPAAKRAISRKMAGIVRLWSSVDLEAIVSWTQWLTTTLYAQYPHQLFIPNSSTVIRFSTTLLLTNKTPSNSPKRSRSRSHQKSQTPSHNLCSQITLFAKGPPAHRPTLQSWISNLQCHSNLSYTSQIFTTQPPGSTCSSSCLSLVRSPISLPEILQPLLSLYWSCSCPSELTPSISPPVWSFSYLEC